MSSVRYFLPFIGTLAAAGCAFPPQEQTPFPAVKQDTRIYAPSQQEITRAVQQSFLQAFMKPDGDWLTTKTMGRYTIMCFRKWREEGCDLSITYSDKGVDEQWVKTFIPDIHEIRLSIVPGQCCIDYVITENPFTGRYDWVAEPRKRADTIDSVVE